MITALWIACAWLFVSGWAVSFSAVTQMPPRPSTRADVAWHAFAMLFWWALAVPAAVVGLYRRWRS